MKTHPSPRKTRLTGVAEQGFTLIELLIVIVIIGVLAGITIPAAKGILSKGNKMAGQNDALQLKNAIAAYFTEYRKYPVHNPTPESGANPSPSDEALMDPLLAADSEAGRGGLNPRQIPFYSGAKAKPLGNGRYRKGVQSNANGGGTLWDPWGEMYRVVMDTDYNNRISSPTFVDDTPFIAQGVIVWSAGEDNDDNDSTDNVVTW